MIRNRIDSSCATYSHALAHSAVDKNWPRPELAPRRTRVPRAHPSNGSQSGSAAPVQPQVPSVLAPGGYSTQLSQVRSVSPSEHGDPCRFLPCTAMPMAGLCTTSGPPSTGAAMLLLLFNTTRLLVLLLLFNTTRARAHAHTLRTPHPSTAEPLSQWTEV